MEVAQYDSIVRIRQSFEVLYFNVVAERFCTIRGQIGENDDDRLVGGRVPVNGVSAQKQVLVTVNEPDDTAHALVGDFLRSEPERLALQCDGYEGTHWPGAAEILVRRGHESFDPVGDCAKRSQIALRELLRLAGVLDDIGWDTTSSSCRTG